MSVINEFEESYNNYYVLIGWRQESVPEAGDITGHSREP